MPKFCVNCGKTLEEGQICECKVEVKEKVNTSQEQSVPNNAANQGTNGFIEFLRNMYVFCIEFIKQPATAIKQVVENENYKAGVFFVAIQAIVLSFFVIALAKWGINSIADIVGPFSGFLPSGDDIPYLEIFFRILVFTAIEFLLLCGITFGLGKLIFKTTGTFKALVGSLGTATIPLSLAFLAAAIFSAIFPSLIIYLILFGAISNGFLSFISIRESLKINEDISLYLIPLSYVVYYFILLKISIEYTKSLF